MKETLLETLKVVMSAFMLLLFVVYVATSLRRGEAALQELERYRLLAPDPIVLQEAMDTWDANERAFDLIFTHGGTWMMDGIAVTCQRYSANVH